MLARIAAVLVWACWAMVACGQSALVDDFEGPEPSLREAGGDANYKVELHRRVAQGAHGGRACEQLRVLGNNGTTVYFSRSIGAPRVIAELAPSIWIKADRPGLQILARVVLPRSADPQSGKPLTTLVRGTPYQQVGAWQQLRVDDLPRLIERQVRVLRAQFGPQVDPREAYVDLILLNVYGGPGVTNAWIDDLEVVGIVGQDAAGNAAQGVAATFTPLPAPGGSPAAWPGGEGVPRVEFKGRLLLVGGRPFFPRAIEYRGEPLSLLQALGFNAVWIARDPPAALVREATGLGMWLVAPPPDARKLASRGAGDATAAIDAAFDPVLAWTLGSGLARRELDAIRHWAELVRASDSRDRPLVCAADSDLYAYTRLADVLVARREPVGSTLPLDQYAHWLRDRLRLARGGTPLWATIQTEPAPQLLEQMALLAGGQPPPVALDEPQIRALVHAALAARARGMCFASNSRLDAPDPATRRRAAILELVNLQIDLIERWPVGGNFAPTASSNDSHTTGAVIETDRSRLLLPIYAPPNSQLVMGNPSVKDLSFTVAGVPEESNAYELSPTAFRPLPSKRITGGTFVTLKENERDSVVVFTQDARVIRAISDRLAKMRARAAQLTVETVNAQLVEVEVTLRRLASVGHASEAAQKLRATAQNDLREAEALRATDPTRAYYRARHAQQALRDVQRAYWEQAMGASDTPPADALAASFATLGEHYRFLHELDSAPRGANRLREGGFEDLQAMRHAGWKYYQHEQPNIATTVDLVPQAAHAGRAGLRLQAAPRDPENKPAVVETPPLWITSPAVDVQPGEVLQIQGWLRVVGPISGSVDGLLVIDSLTGESLAQRITAAGDWRQFTVYRAAPRGGPMAVTFALSGLGEVWIDDVTIVPVMRGGSQPPRTEQAQAPAGPARAAP